jgi:hypothetical protein
MSNKWRDKLANYHLNPRMVLLAFVVLFGTIFLASALDPYGGSWYNLGGVMRYGYYPGEGSDHNPISYVVGTDGSLWGKPNYSGLGWYYLGGQITSSPKVWRDHAGWDHVFVRGTDGQLWDRRVDRNSITPTEAPGDWTCLGGYIKDGTTPSISPLGDEYLEILVHGGDDGLWKKRITVTTPYSLTEITPIIQGSWVNLGGKIIGSPSDIAFSSVTQIVAVRGLDNSLWVNTRHGEDDLPSFWYHLGGVLASDPSLSGNLMVYVKGTDGALWVNKFDDMTNTGAWTHLGGQISGSDSPATASVWESDCVLVKGADNGLWACEVRFPTDGVLGWTWHNLGGQITSRPSIFNSFVFGDVFIFVRGGDGALWDYSKTIPV